MHQRPYEKLIVWQEAHRLCLSIYALTKSFPQDERFALISQIRRASTSVPTNIAEGNSRRFFKEKLQFLNIAHASLEELHYQLRLSKDLKYISEKVFYELDDKVQRTSFLIEKLRASFH